ncbi:MAG: discoidin domain-containing protein [Acidobacteria bacterium]|nr:discoidin domain-containing protein [Acidobacteriota bacterium]
MSRQIPPTGTVYWNVPKDMPGVGPYSRFRVAAPGKLLVLEQTGATRVLVDGSNPTAASLNLIDVNAPDVSYDGKKIVFAGIPSTAFNASEDTQPLANPSAWRLYVINADGSGLRQITKSDQSLNYSQFGQDAGSRMQTYDDTDPAWMPDGRIVFSSTRLPGFAQYGGARASNLYVVNADGTALHRITAERNGADRPVIDPVTGEITFSRWWRNHRFATNDMSTVASSAGGYEQKDGLTRNRDNHVGGADFLFRNNWHTATIRPDGTELAQFAGPHNHEDAVHAYGGSFAPDGTFVANFFPMQNMTEAGGFGGLRRYTRRQVDYKAIIGITQLEGNRYVSSNPTSFGVYQGSYATEPAVLNDGRIVISWASDINQDYGLYLIDQNGGGRTLLYDSRGTTELRAKLLQARPVPPILSDSVTQLSQTLPPKEAGPYDADGTFFFDALNVYANGPVDSITTSAPPVGSAAKIRFFADFQRTNPGSFETLDWPILLNEATVNPDGSVTHDAPAGVPLVEQIRSADGTVPFTMGAPGGAAHVAGMNYGMPGSHARCVGCHSGHTQIPVPATDEEAKWSNLAPGAELRVSSTRDSTAIKGLTDRKVQRGDPYEYWTASGTQGEWVELTFPEAVTVRTVRLYSPRTNTGANMQIQSATVRVGPSSGNWTATQTTGALSESGVDATFAEVQAQVVRVELGAVSGRLHDGSPNASLAEVEVIAKAGAGGSTQKPSGPNTRAVVKMLSPTNGSTYSGQIKFSATAIDAEDGDISSEILWHSSLQGHFGKGASITATLQPGSHGITALLKDSGGLTAGTGVRITVNAPSAANTRAVVKMLSPTNGSTYSGPITFTATAIDAEDGDISSEILWHSSLQGHFGKGASITATLQPGSHGITALLKDSGGLTAGTGVRITVK